MCINMCTSIISTGTVYINMCTFFSFFFFKTWDVKIFEYCFIWCSSKKMDVEIFLWRITYADILLYKMNGTSKALALN